MPTPDEIAFLFKMSQDPAFARERAKRAAAFDPNRAWVDGSPRRLSDRVWDAKQWSRSQIDAILTHAIATGEDALKTAKKLEQFLDPAYAPIRTTKGRLVRNQRRAIVTQAPGRGGSGSFPARRLARTEITRAHGKGTIDAATATPFAQGVKWSLSGRHPKADVCNERATADGGLGPGVYPANAVPTYPTHPQDLCTLSVSMREDIDAIVDELRREFGLDEGAAAAPAETLAAPQGTPVSDALAVPAGKYKPEVERALRAIDAVHGDGPLPHIPVKWTSGKMTRGSYDFYVNGPARSIGISTKGDTPALDFIHEVGHFLDNKGIGNTGNFATGSPNPDMVRLLAPWRDAVKNSRAAADLGKLWAQGGYDSKYVRYLAGYEELWARSYAQYVAVKSGDDVLLAQLVGMRGPDQYGRTYPVQWDDDDFAPIKEALDGIFTALGWIA